MNDMQAQNMDTAQVAHVAETARTSSAARACPALCDDGRQAFDTPCSACEAGRALQAMRDAIDAEIDAMPEPMADATTHRAQVNGMDTGTGYGARFDALATAAMDNADVRAHVARACFNGGHDSAAEDWTRATVAQVAATGAACTVSVESRPGMPFPAVHVWTGDDAGKLAGLAAAGMIDLHAGHVGCSAYCTCDAEDGADMPAWDTAARVAIDVNGQADTVRAIVKHRTGRPAWHALGMYRGDILPSLLAYVADTARGTARAQVAAIHRDLREQVAGYGCAAVWARQD